MPAEYWEPPSIWIGQACFVLGCGASLCDHDVEQLRGRNVIAVNHAFRLAPWAPFLFFNDTQWFRDHEEEVQRFAGLAVTCSRYAAAKGWPNVRRPAFEIFANGFPLPGSGVLRHGASSGHKAVSLAVGLGAASVVLLGFDMRRDAAGRAHFHADYPWKDHDPRFRDLFIPGFDGWFAAAAAVGCTIRNATPGSALREFPSVSLDEVLTCEAS